MHSIKVEKKKLLILKLDLVKAFDRVNWTFLRLVLLQIGIPLCGVNWIMGCVVSSNFAFLVNGFPSHLFLISRGIREGCLLSPLLFILIIESLSLMISNAAQSGLITCVKITTSLNLTHFIFLYDVILFGIPTLEEWDHYKELLDLFFSATGMRNHNFCIMRLMNISELLSWPCYHTKWSHSRRVSNTWDTISNL